MNKQEIITIAGAPGSGKSSTADGVARELDFKRFSSGDFMRKIALELGLSSTPEEIYQKITKRLTSEKKRYMELYGIDHTDKNNFDLVIDTNKNNLQEVVQIIVSEYKKWIKEN